MCFFFNSVIIFRGGHYVCSPRAPKKKLIHLCFDTLLYYCIDCRSCDCASWRISYNKPTRCINFSNLFWKLYMFRTVPLSIIRSFSLYTQQWYNGTCHTGLLTACMHGSCQQNCMTCTIAVCTEKNSWWWTEELSETCRVSFQNKFEKLMHLVGFIIRKCIDCPCLH